MREFSHHSAVLAALALVGGDLVTAGSSSLFPSSASARPAPTGATYASGFDIKTSWANLSPYKDADGFNLSKGVPPGCELSQVHVLHRHAQRYPTHYENDAGIMEEFGQKLLNYSRSHPNTAVATGPLAFLNDWEYLLGVDLLLTSGAATEATSGADFWSRYGRALYRAPAGQAHWNESLNVYPNGTARPKPVFRTTTYPRILESARWWLSGFFGNTGANDSYSQYDLVEFPEVSPFNVTLASGDACTKDIEKGYTELDIFLETFLESTTTRLSKYFPKDFDLSTDNVFGMMNLCPYEYATLGTSSFCSLFTEQEWRNYEYSLDLEFYYQYGYGAPIGRARGIGYIQELAARLESKLIYSSDTSINYTYDDNTAQFPLHQPLYMDMSHDDVITSVITALGLEYFKFPGGLKANITTPPSRNFNLNHMVPFGARFVSEVWTCPSNASFDNLGATLYKNPDLSSKSGTTDYIRFVLNNAPVPLDGLPGCEDAQNGFCPVSDFLSGVPDLTKDAKYQYACFGNYSVSVPVNDGVPK